MPSWAMITPVAVILMTYNETLAKEQRMTKRETNRRFSTLNGP